MWFADALTLARIPLAVLFWWTYGDAAWSFAVVALAALTDTIDGHVARHSKRRRGLPDDAPSRGDWLDPIADKLFVGVVIATVVAHRDAPLAVLGLIAAREVFFLPLAALAGLGVVRRPPRHELRAARIGKWCTVAQLCALGAVVVAPASAVTLALAIVAGVTGVAAVVRYAVAAVAPARLAVR
jgi:phosphatidylglycerophosphate synthase